MSQFEVDGTLPTAMSSGIDEVGRGCLAGPVVVAAVTWDHVHAARQPWFGALADSKQMRPQQRAALFPLILAQATRARVAILSQMLIDELNILVASLHGFELVAPAYDAAVPLFIDGNQCPKRLPWAKTLVGGDGRQSAIAAASVLAKVTRDALMVRLDERFPVYGFARNMGYGTVEHRQALARHGACMIHRKSFAPVAQRCCEPVPADAALLARVHAAELAELPTLWSDFSEGYAAFSRDGARQLMAAFQRRGLRILPSPRDGATV